MNREEKQEETKEVKSLDAYIEQVTKLLQKHMKKNCSLENKSIAAIYGKKSVSASNAIMQIAKLIRSNVASSFKNKTRRYRTIKKKSLKKKAA